LPAHTHRLHHKRIADVFERGDRVIGIRKEPYICAVGILWRSKNSFEKILLPSSCAQAGWTNDRQVARTKRVGDAIHERQLGTTTVRSDALFCECGERRNTPCINSYALRFRRDSAIAGSAPDFFDARLSRSFHTSACSLPPPPMIRTFTYDPCPANKTVKATIVVCAECQSLSTNRDGAAVALRNGDAFLSRVWSQKWENCKRTYCPAETNRSD